MKNKSQAFDLQPTLTGPTTIVRPLSSDDWPALLSVASDPEIWALHPASDRYQEDVFRQFFADAMAGGGAFAFVDKPSGKIIGSSRYNGLDENLSEIEIGWTFLARSEWGGTRNREVKTLMLDHAFQFVETVVFWVGKSNARSCGAMEKIGGTRRDGIRFRDAARAHPCVVYEISRAAWRG